MDDSFDSSLDSGHASILEDELHDFGIDLKVGLMMAIPAMKTLAAKGNDLIDNLHDVLSVIPAFPVADVEPVVPEKLKLVTGPIVDL